MNFKRMMKQPQLGKKVTELRLKKGFTQTELAEQCSLSLRTIQRIEASEVTPRSYTLKLIFENLDYDIFNSTDEKHSFVSKSFFNLKSSKTQKIIAFGFIIATTILCFLKFNSNDKIDVSSNAVQIIKTSQKNMKRWMNTKQIDSVMGLFSDNACFLNTKCGKTQIRQIMTDIFSTDYELIDYTSLNISVDGTIAVEKYRSVYNYKGRIREQIGITEWNLIDKKWLIVNDMFRDK